MHRCDTQGFKMSSKKPLIPFAWMPGSWGLRGKTREIAQAEYELSGEELELRLLEINHRDDPKNLQLHKLNLELNTGKIDQYTYDRGLAAIQEYADDQAKNLAMLEVVRSASCRFFQAYLGYYRPCPWQQE